jgi:diaminohydroxyphosphoribosylaminopyrimidine deaminase/5-amino-6-(5-phosphoribosylamino)uracil reductase
VKIVLKLATSLDGRIATASGESRWITGEPARRQVHRLRAASQAVLVGVETAIADDPDLTVRLAGFVGAQPARVVLDSRGRLPAGSKLVTSADRIRTVVITTQAEIPQLSDTAVTVIRVPARDGRCDPAAVGPALGKYLENQASFLAEIVRPHAEEGGLPIPERGAVKSSFPGVAEGGTVLVEGGGQVAASFIAADLVDAIEWFRAPIVLGDEGRPAVGEFILQHLASAPRFRRKEVRELGDDLWERYERV